MGTLPIAKKEGDKMKLSKNSLIAITASVILLWCVTASAQDIKYNFMPGTDFAKYKLTSGCGFRTLNIPIRFSITKSCRRLTQLRLRMAKRTAKVWT